MRIFVASGFEALSLYAHAINTVKMAQGFARLGHEITFICWRPSGQNVTQETLSRVYGLTETFQWLLLPQKNLWQKPEHKPWAMAVMVALAALWRRPHLIFCRDYITPWLTSYIGWPTVAESHAAPGYDSPHFRRFLRATHYQGFKLWVTISHRLVEHYQTQGVPANKLIVLPDAVDLAQFQRPTSLPPNPYHTSDPCAGYVGHLYDYKGVPVVLAAAALLPNIQFHLVGGLPDDIARHQVTIQEMKLSNVFFHGLKPQIEIPPFLWHANVLLLPPSAQHPSAAWTSPVKLGEYLASGTSIVASDIPALRDWLTDTEVKFVAPDNPEAMAAGIMEILNNPDYALRLSQNGIQKAQSLSYENRAEQILMRLV